MAQLRQPIVKLAKMIGGIAGAVNKIDENAPEYYSLAAALTDEQAELALAFGLRKERTVSWLAKKWGKPLEEARKIAMEFAQIGICKFFVNDSGEDTFFVQIFAPGILEMMVGNAELVEAHPEIGKAFEEYTRLRIAPMGPKFPMGHSMMRVIPVESAIDANTQAVPYERISYYLEKYDTFSVSPCSCRRSRRVLGEGCGHLEQDMCIQLGTGAEYYIKTGRARQITREEAYEIIKKAEENGLMHEIPNIEGVGETAAICNCCGCSCFSLRCANMFRSPDGLRSNYRSEITPENCVACGQCVESCPTNALHLGQKLCSKTPIKPLEPSKSPRDFVWHESDWNKDYRENRWDVLDSGTAPCKAACPAHIAVQGYIKLAAQGKYMEALELIKKENPFPAVCGRICPKGCESACTRGELDSPIAIDEIKKFIADKELESSARFIPKKRYDCSGKKVAIIGAGPAGLACAYYLARDNYDITVFEKQEKLGGMLTLGIPAFRLEKNVVDAEIEVLRELGVNFRTGCEVGKDVTLDELRNEGYKAFYLAIGAQGGRKLGLEGEDAQGVIAGVDFLRDVSLGKDVKLSGKVVVIGGGNVAIDVARTAVRQGGETINMYCLESADEMPALPEEIEEAQAENIAINNGWGPKRILCEDGKVKGIEFKKCVSVFRDGKFAPEYDESQILTVEADHILLSVGQSIEWGKLLEGSRVELGRGNTAQADALTYQTAQPDIFVGGDAFSGPKFAIDAIAAGKQGAESLHRFVSPGQSLTAGRDRREYKSLDKANVVVEGYDNTPRQKAGHNTENEKTFKDTRLTFTEEQLKKETERCLGCGAVQVDTTMCIGCGLCTVKCKFDAIHLVKVADVFAKKFENLPIEMAKNAVKRTANIAAVAAKKPFSK